MERGDCFRGGQDYPAFCCLGETCEAVSERVGRNSRWPWNVTWTFFRWRRLNRRSVSAGKCRAASPRARIPVQTAFPVSFAGVAQAQDFLRWWKSQFAACPSAPRPGSKNRTVPAHPLRCTKRRAAAPREKFFCAMKSMMLPPQRRNNLPSRSRETNVAAGEFVPRAPSAPPARLLSAQPRGS